MGKVFLNSIFTKGIGAVLEVVLQIIIMRFLHVDGYGDYGFFVGLADMGYWIFFSAITKCNIFYCSQNKNRIDAFRKKYYFRYVLPILLVCLGAAVFSKNLLLVFSAAILLIEVLVLDKSSQMLASGRYNLSLVGEYCLGRVFLLLFTTLFGFVGILTLHSLLLLYLLQYILVYLVFVIRDKRISDAAEVKCSLNKVVVYQYGDLLYGVIQKAPVILEYLFTGAFAAGFVNLVGIVRTVVAFVSGPTSKVFLPSFAKLYQSGENGKIVELFRKVIILQMIFLSVVGVVLLGFPELVLRIFDQELVGYASEFSGVSLCFLIALSFGPCSGLMQMTGKEKTDIFIRSSSVIFMILIWIVTRKNKLFVLYGIGSQILSENLIDYYVISKILGKIPVGILRFVVLWMPTILVVGIVRICKLPQNMLVMSVAVMLEFILYCAIQLADKQVRNWIKEEVVHGIIKK